jgi:hypothetical protein
MKTGSEEWWLEKMKEVRNEAWRLGFQAGFSLSALVFGVLFNLDKFK